MELNRDFKGVWIPRAVWLSKELSAIDKVILTEIHSLDNENHCTASNEYFSEFCGVSIPTVTRSIKKLKDMGFIEQTMEFGRSGSYRVIKMMRGSNQFDEGVSSKRLANNIDNNIYREKDISNKLDISKDPPRSSFVKPTVDEVRAYCIERGNTVDAEAFVDYYESNGWYVSHHKMKDWRAAVRTWEKRDNRKPTKKSASNDMPDWMRKIMEEED